MNNTQVLPEDHPAVLKIKDTIVELDSLLETYRDLNIEAYLMNAIQSSSNLPHSIARLITHNSEYSHPFASSVAKMFSHELTEECEINDSLRNTFYATLAYYVANNYMVKEQTISQSKEAIHDYLDSTDFSRMMNNIIKDKINETLQSSNLKLSLS